MRATTSFAVQGRLVYTAHHSFAGLCDKKLSRRDAQQQHTAGAGRRVVALRAPQAIAGAKPRARRFFLVLGAG